MKKNTHYLEISINKPCSQSWNGMRPEKNGRHCAQCDKVVRDFTQATDTELADFFRHYPANVCGRFRAGQLRRPLAFTPILAPVRPSHWRAAALMGGLMLGAGMAAGQSMETSLPIVNEVPPPPEMEVVGEIQTLTDEAVQGRVVNEQGESMIGVHVLFEGTHWGTVTDFDGYFVLARPDSATHFALSFSFIGYQTKIMPLDMGKLDLTEPLLIQLQAEIYSLDEVVVTGSGILYGNVGLVSYISYSHELSYFDPVEEKDIDNTLVTFPNPFREALNIRFQAPQAGRYQLQLVDLSGRILEQYATHFEQGEQQISAAFSLKHLPAGTYVFRLQAPDDTVWVKQVVKAG